MNNYEKIKNMSIEDMANFIRQEQLNALYYNDCNKYTYIKEWLKQEMSTFNK